MMIVVITMVMNAVMLTVVVMMTVMNAVMMTAIVIMYDNGGDDNDGSKVIVKMNKVRICWDMNKV